MYKSIKISYKKYLELIKDKNWIWICENSYGVCYWNKETGELIWMSDDEIKLQKKIKDQECL